MLACWNGHHDVAVMLISKGADIHQVDKVSDTSSCVIVQIKCVVTESLTLHMCMHAYMYACTVYNSYLYTMCCCFTVGWRHPITVSLL